MNELLCPSCQKDTMYHQWKNKNTFRRDYKTVINLVNRKIKEYNTYQLSNSKPTVVSQHISLKQLLLDQYAVNWLQKN